MKLLSVREVSKILGVHHSVVQRMAQTGELPMFKITGPYSNWKIREDALDEWIKEKELTSRRTHSGS